MVFKDGALGAVKEESVGEEEEEDHIVIKGKYARGRLRKTPDHETIQF